MLRDFAQLSCDHDQRPKTTSPVAIQLNSNDAILGIEHTASKDNSKIKIKNSGLYWIMAAPQLGRLKGEVPRHVDIWLRRNGEDVPNSNIRATLSNSNSKGVVVNQSMMPLKREDIIEIMMSVEVAEEGLGLDAIKPKGEPIIPSIILSMRLVEEYDDLLDEESGVVFK